jgi:hypothetical protein
LIKTVDVIVHHEDFTEHVVESDRLSSLVKLRSFTTTNDKVSTIFVPLSREFSVSDFMSSSFSELKCIINSGEMFFSD